MKKKTNNTRNIIIVLGTLLLVLLFLLFASNGYKIPSLSKKEEKKEQQTPKEEYKKVEDKNEANEEDENGQEEEEGEKPRFSGKEKLLMSEYVKLTSFVKNDGMTLFITLDKYLAEYEKTGLSDAEFFESWYKKYEEDKTSIAKEPLSDEEEKRLNEERNAAILDKVKSIIAETENLTNSDKQGFIRKYNISEEELDTLINGQLKVMRYALENIEPFDFPIESYIKQYTSERDTYTGTNKAEEFNRDNYNAFGIN